MQCVTAVRGAFQTIDDMLKEGKVDQIARDFNTCTNLTSEQDVPLFLSKLALLFKGAVQYDSQILPFGVNFMCTVMTESHNFYRNLVSFIRVTFVPDLFSR